MQVTLDPGPPSSPRLPEGSALLQVQVHLSAPGQPREEMVLLLFPGEEPGPRIRHSCGAAGRSPSRLPGSKAHETSRLSEVRHPHSPQPLTAGLSNSPDPTSSLELMRYGATHWS